MKQGTLVQGLPEGNDIYLYFWSSTYCLFFLRRRRNGGHISPNVYDDYSGLKKKHGASLALQILRFRLAHISVLIAAAEEEGLLSESQARVVEEFDVFMQQSMFEDAKNELYPFLKEAQEDNDKFQVLESHEDLEVRVLSKTCA